MTATAIRRPLNYYGSKEKLCPIIHALIPSGPSTWVDVFCGSAIVTLKKDRHPREVINDANRDIVTLFDVLRSERAPELYAAIETTPYAEELLYRAYETDPGEDPVSKALHFLIRSWFGRGGDDHKTGFRWSKSMTTSPEMLWARMPARLQVVADRLRGVCIRSVDAFKILTDYNHPDCLLFVDPPYPGDAGRRYAVRMSDDQHEALARELAASRSKVILTMNPATIYSQVLKDWVETPVTVQGGGNAFKREIILTNFRPTRAHVQALLPLTTSPAA